MVTNKVQVRQRAYKLLTQRDRIFQLAKRSRAVAFRLGR